MIQFTKVIDTIIDLKKNLPKRENGGLIDQINNMDLTKLNSIEKDTLLQLLLQKASL